MDIELLREAVNETLLGYEIDYGNLPYDEKTLTEILMLDAIELYKTLPNESRELALLASVVCLLLENFVLHNRLLNK